VQGEAARSSGSPWRQARLTILPLRRRAQRITLGVRAVIAQSLLLKHQLLILNRSRNRAARRIPLARALVGIGASWRLPLDQQFAMDTKACIDSLFSLRLLGKKTHQ
jgi:hypothetical protein